MNTHKIPFSNIKKKIVRNYTKYNNVCSYGIFLLETQERARNSRGKQAIGVRATEVLLYLSIEASTICVNEFSNLYS